MFPRESSTSPRLRLPALLAFTLLALAGPMAAIPIPVPVTDINSLTGGGNLDLGAEMGGYFYYSACEDHFGCELYRTPLTGAGAELVADLHAAGSSNPTGFVNAGGTLFFRAFGATLFKSDGTAAGTVPVASFSQLSVGPDEEMAALGNEVIFKAQHGSTYGDVWVSDGTTTTPFDICPGACDASVYEFTPVGPRVFFRADDGSGPDLWKYEAGSVTQVDVNPSGAAFPGDLNPMGSQLVFQANVSEVGLWLSDGTTNTKIAGSAQDFYGLNEMVVAGGLAYFDGCCAAGQGRELWVSNGTTPGTVPIKDIRPGPVGSDPRQLTAVGSSTFFTADDGTGGRELWISVLANATNTVPLEIVPGAGQPSYLGGLTNLDGGQLLLIADDGSGFGREPWISDGTPGGTTIVGDLAAGPAWGISEPLVAAAGWVYFPSSALDSGDELWRTDGSSALKLTDIDTTTDGSGIGSITAFGGFGYFCAEDGFHGTELWRTDGTSAGTELLEDIAPPGGQYGCDLNVGVVAAAGTLFFVGHDGSSWGLWATNGSPGGATLMGSFVSAPRQLTEHLGTLYFEGNDGAGAGAELWRSNGSAGGTFLVEDIYPGSVGGGITDLTSAGGLLLFGARYWTGGSNTGDFELFRSDGTGGTGTTLVKDIRPGTAGSFPKNFAAVGGTVIFTADNGSAGTELWKTNGDGSGTMLVKDIRSGSSGGAGSVNGFAVLGGHAYFPANDGSSGTELWRTDGTLGGTVLFEDIRSGGSSSPQDFAVAGSTLLFSADDGSTGREPWITDGSTTFQLADANPSGSSTAREFFGTGVGDEAYFSADDGSGGGSELWHTDGSALGTTKLADLYPDGGSNPEAFARVGSQVVFVAYVGTSGKELWRFDEADCGDAPDSDYQTLLASGGPCHRLAENSLFLGTQRDADPDGQPTATADGDDIDGQNDEDGVSFVSGFAPGSLATFEVTLSAAGRLNAWFDWDADGDWDDSAEHAIFSLALAAGTHSLSVEVPGSATLGTTFSRFRVDSTGSPFPGGGLFDGEVEDHAIEIALAADLAIDKSAPATAISGTLISYTLVASNPTGPEDAAEATVADAFAAGLSGCGWTCSGDSGGSCSNASGTGDIDELVDLPVTGTVTFEVTCAIGASETGSLANTATVVAPSGIVDPISSNDSSSVMTDLQPTADLAISKTDGLNVLVPPDSLAYTIQIQNQGPSDVFSAQVSDTFPALVTNVDWTCVGNGGGFCSASGSGNISESVDLPAGSAVTFTATGDVDDGAPGTLTNTATVSPPAGVADPVAGNNSATDETQLVTTTVIFIDGFESGDTSQWSATEGGQAPAFTTGASNDLELTLLLEGPALERSGRARTRIATGQGASGVPLFELYLEIEDGRYRLVPLILDPRGSWQRGAARWFDTLPPSVSLHWKRALMGGDGSLVLFAGSTYAGRLEGVDDSGQALVRVQTHRVGDRNVVKSWRSE